MGATGLDAVVVFLSRTLRRRWCDALGLSPNYAEMRRSLLVDLDEIKEDLSVLRDADRNVASMRFVRGIDLMIRMSLPKNTSDTTEAEKKGADSGWKEDLMASLDSAEQGYYRVKFMEQKILCFEIMCSCFLLLRSPETAFYSILNGVKVLMHEGAIELAWQSLQRAVDTGAPVTPEECRLLELFLSRVCGIVAACEHMPEYTPQVRDEFRKLFRSNPHVVRATDPTSFFKWDVLRVYKHKTSVRVFGTAAHVLIPVVPVVAGVATMLTAGYYIPKNAGVNTLDSVALKETSKDERDDCTANLYDFRWSLLDLAHSQSEQRYGLGRVSLSIDSKRNIWNVIAHESENEDEGVADDGDDEIQGRVVEVSVVNEEVSGHTTTTEVTSASGE